MAPQALMLLNEPAPQSIPNIMVEVIENGAGTGAEAIIVAPAAQKSIDPLEAVSRELGSESRRVSCLTRYRRSACLCLGISIRGMSPNW